jgi:cell division protein FtsQ
MKMIARLLFSVTTLALVLAAAAASPRALRHVDGFRVRQVDVRGSQYLAPREAVQASGITTSSNLFDDVSPWKDALEKHPLIAEARIDRVLPNTVRLRITEVQPIALLAGADADGDAGVSLRAVSADGVILPIDLSKADLDLPVVSASAGAADVLRFLASIRAADFAVYDWISDAATDGHAGVRTRLRAPAAAEALFPVDLPETQLKQLKTAIADLVAREEIGQLVSIDARFKDQIVTKLLKRQQ